MNFLRFFISKLFLSHLLLAIILMLFLIGVCLFGLHSFTEHGKHVKVPNIEAFTLREVKLIIEQSKLRFEVLDSTKYNPNYPPLSVIEQIPVAGSEVKRGRKIYLTINPSGYRRLSVPNIIQITKRNAKTKLTAVGFEVGEITYRNNIGKNMVLEIRYNGEKIKPGTVLPKTSKIDLVLGNGKR